MQDIAAKAINDLLRQFVNVDPNANMLAKGLRPLGAGPCKSLHTSRTSAAQFPLIVREDDDSVRATLPRLPLADLTTKANPFYDPGVLAYYAKAGGAAPPTPFGKRKVLGAAVWYVPVAPCVS